MIEMRRAQTSNFIRGISEISNERNASPAEETYSPPLFALAMNRDKDERTTDRIAYAFLRTLFLFGLVAWGYVAAMQLRNFHLVYRPLAEWVPIRLDYFGEASFILSMVAYFLLKFWETKK
jgi:hypothetical protein